MTRKRMGRPPTDPMERFGNRVEVLDNGCHEWTGGRTFGYGAFWFDGSNRRAHRWLWEQTHGPVPDGFELDHLCRNRACVNLDHLEAVTHQVNALRRSAALRGDREGCPHGHDASETVTKVYESGTTRYCRACIRERKRRKDRANGVEPRKTIANGGITECKRGHPYPESLGKNGDHWLCRSCANDAQREKRRNG